LIAVVTYDGFAECDLKFFELGVYGSGVNGCGWYRSTSRLRASTADERALIIAYEFKKRVAKVDGSQSIINRVA
jgi:hypothetical protein